MVFSRARAVATALVVLAGIAVPWPRAFAQAPQPSASQLSISWEVRNRFRLFREERDFQLQAEALTGRDILASEKALAVQSDGRGWARNTFNRLCIDPTGRITEPCTRDNVKESYLTPTEHPVTIRLSGEVPVGAICAWSFEDGDAPRQSTFDCSEPINMRVRYGRTTNVSVDVSSSDAPQRVTEAITVRDVFIAGLGDSIASGEGNPDKAVTLSDDGFCFKSYLGGPSNQYFRPSRAAFKGARACETGDNLQAWQRAGAQWFNAACHRSLYSYQTRTAIALAVRNPQIAVTYLPLACTGATIAEGLLGAQRARECAVVRNNLVCAGNINAQVNELREALNAATTRQPGRQLDLVMLSVGANDVNFSGLVADVILESGTERALSQRAGMIGTVDDARAVMARDLPSGFAKLRQALKPLVGGDLARVLYVSYGNPTFVDGQPCPGGRGGFDIHPAFSANPARLSNVANFVQREFLPRMKNLALCSGGVLCASGEKMTFVDQHQAEFTRHGFCARAESDPPFDQQCFLTNGESFVTDIASAANNPLTCGAGASDFRAYAPRARWVRDANDSYFTAMTYPLAARNSSVPSDIHDASWGIYSAVYGGAIHPTAEGHAAMADAALPAAANVLGLGGPEAKITSEPIAPLQAEKP